MSSVDIFFPFFVCCMRQIPQIGFDKITMRWFDEGQNGLDCNPGYFGNSVADLQGSGILGIQPDKIRNAPRRNKRRNGSAAVRRKGLSDPNSERRCGCCANAAGRILGGRSAGGNAAKLSSGGIESPGSCGPYLYDQTQYPKSKTPGRRTLYRSFLLPGLCRTWFLYG